MIAFLSLDGFYIGVLGNGAPLTVVHRDKQVLDADQAARARNIYVGMPLAEAKAILAGDGYFVAWEEEKFRAAQRAWIDRATDITDALEPCGQHAAFCDLSGHARPAEVIAHLVRDLKTKLGLESSYGLASCRWVAREAWFRGDESLAALHIPRRFVSSLPANRLPLPDDVITRLVLLGYRTIGEVARLPFESLQAQFGEQAFDIQRMALGSGDAEVEAVFPANALADRFVFDGAPDTVEVLEFGLAKLACRLGGHLRADDASAKTVELFIEGEDGSIEARRRTFSKAISGTALLTSAFRLMLDKLPLQPVAAIRVRLPDVKRANRVQLGIDGVTSRLDQERSIEAALTNARTAFGDGAVMRGSEIAEPRHTKVRRAFTLAYGWSWG